MKPATTVCCRAPVFCVPVHGGRSGLGSRERVVRYRTTPGPKSEPAMEPAQSREETGPGPQHGSGLLPGEAHNRGLLERVPDVLLVADPHGTVLLANRRAAELFGRPSPEALTGQSIPALVVLSIANECG